MTPNLLITNVVLLSIPIFMVVVAAKLEDNNQIAKPGCVDECGEVKIPFPFGIGEGCYLQNDTRFYIKCNNYTNPKLTFPVLGYLNGTSNHRVLDIDLSDHSIRLSSGVAYRCYNGGKPVATNSSTYDLDFVKFSISTKRNKFVAIGCDTWARVEDSESQAGQLDLNGCMTSCPSIESVSHLKTCLGRGCCEIAISDSMSRPRIQVDSFHNHTYVEDFNPCSFAFVGEVGLYRFAMANLTTPATAYEKIRVPVSYDWYIFQRDVNGATICGPHTKSVDRDYGVKGYHCECLEGFIGNPYLSQGCQDIDECQDYSLNHCQLEMFCIGHERSLHSRDCRAIQHCVNKIGGYECYCPNGFIGNGTKTSPCVQAPVAVTRITKLVIGLSLGIGLLTALIISYGMHKLVKRSKAKNERENNFKRNGGLLLQQRMSTNEGSIERTRMFSRIELVRATDNFNESRVLGRGGQGTVYKGMLVDGTIVAVKKSMKVNETQLSQFINEVVILSQINHRHVVKLFGCCLETEVPLLVYEFVPNGT